MRIGLNLLHALPEIGGGWNYIARLVDALAAHPGGHSLVAFCSPHSAVLVPESTGGIERVVLPVDTRSRAARIVAEHRALLREGRRRGVEVMHHFSGTMPFVSGWANVVTVYDLLPFRDPAAFPLLKRAYLHAVVPRSLRRAEVLTPMSAATAMDVERHFGVPVDAMVVVPAVVGDAFHPVDRTQTESLRRRLALPERFWLYVAHHYPHKNHRRLLEAFAGGAGATVPAWPLVLRGEGVEAALAADVAVLGLGDRVRFLPRLDGDDMPILYSAASGLVFPSQFEGGGIPVLEAMACGCPVLASDIPTTREFAGDAAALFAPEDVSALRATLVRAEREPAWLDELRRRGLAQAARFRAERVAALCHAAYARAAGAAAAR